MFIAPSPRRGLFFPPGAVPRINEQHPAASACIGAWLFGPRPITLRGGLGPMTPLAGTTGIAVGRTGAYSVYSQGQSHTAPRSPTGDISIVAVAMRSITPGANGSASQVQVLAASMAVNATRSGIEWDIGNSFTGSPNAMIAARYVAGNADSTGIGLWVNGAKETVTSGVGSTSLVNGVWYGLGATFPGMVAGNNGLTVGSFFDGYYYLSGGVQFLAVFRGILPDGLMGELTLNPAGILRWPDDQIWWARVSSIVSVALTGQSATFAQGAVSLAPSAPLFGQAVTFAAGSLGVGGAAGLTGIQAAFAAGSLTPSSDYASGDTHDGFKRRSRRERALAAAEQRRRDVMAEEAAALRLSLESAMGMAAEVVDDAPASEAATIQGVVREARAWAPRLTTTPDPHVLQAARDAVAALHEAMEAYKRARMLAEDDEDVLILLRAL